MKLSVLKEDFYKRFGKTNTYLYSEKCGMICTLLGFSESDFTNSLNTELCPNVYAIGCSDTTSKITIANTSLLLNKTYNSKSSGAKILFHSDIPQNFRSNKSVQICIERLLKKIDADFNSDDTTNIRRGYCRENSIYKSSEYPFPISGYNLVYVYFREEKKSPDICKIAKRAFTITKRILPRIRTLGDISQNDFSVLKEVITDYETLNFVKFITEENERIALSCERLKKLDIDTLFSQIISSCKSMNLYLAIPPVFRQLSEVVSVIPCIKAYRYTDNGLFYIVREDMTDYSISTIRNDFMGRYGIWLNFCISAM